MRPRPPRPRSATLLLAAAGLLVACGDRPSSPVAETSANLSEIRSGILGLRLAVESPQDGPVGFELDGTFSLPEEGGLPTADLEYTRLLGDETAAITFLADGERAVVVTEEGPIEVDDAGLARLEVSGAGSGSDLFDELDLEAWLSDVRTTPGPQGTNTDRVTASLDAGAALRDLLETGRRFGAEGIPGLEGLESATEETIRNAVRSSSFELVTGSEDRLLRELLVTIEFGAPLQVSGGLEDVDGVRLSLEVSIENPNRPIPQPALPDTL